MSRTNPIFFFSCKYFLRLLSFIKFSIFLEKSTSIFSRNWWRMKLCFYQNSFWFSRSHSDCLCFPFWRHVVITRLWTFISFLRFKSFYFWSKFRWWIDFINANFLKTWVFNLFHSFIFLINLIKTYCWRIKSRT